LTIPSSPTFRWQTSLPGGRQLGLLVRANAINLLVDDEQPSYTFDPAGRLHGAFQDGINYRRSLDNRVLSKWTARIDGRSRRQRHWLSSSQARELVASAYRWVAQARSQAATAPAAVRLALLRLARWDWDALEADRQRFQQIYTPVGILPPDQYLALVLQATHGCTHNACTFCTFYRDIPFRIKSPAEFRAHVDHVLAFFGPALAMRRSIFLADANALVVPMPRLLELLDVFSAIDHSSFVVHRSSLPLFAFIDAFHVHRKSLADWQELGARGLRRVYIGMESGHDPLLRWLNKPGQAADVLDAVTALKTAGLSASVIVMLGIGGGRYAAGHLQDTVALLNAMPLSGDDLIYLSDFVESPQAPYARLAAEAGIASLDPRELRAQEDAIKQAFIPRDPESPPKFARYDIREFVY
jgi:hypothetical protein